MDWLPLSRRTSGHTEPLPLVEGVPNHLAAPLAGWLETSLDKELVERLGLRLRIPIDPLYWMQDLVAKAADTDELFLDVVDAAVALLAENASYVTSGRAIRANDDIHRLVVLLDEAGSAWRVATSGAALERRLDPTVVEAATEAMTMAPASAATHLEAAWRAAFGRHPDPTKAYSEAVKAVEATVIPVVQPNHAKATLGTVLGELRDHSDRWELAILDANRAPASIDPVISVARTLWSGQSDRHGGNDPTVHVSEEAAEAGVQLAVLLVAWFSSGAVRLR